MRGGNRETEIQTRQDKRNKERGCRNREREMRDGDRGRDSDETERGRN